MDKPPADALKAAVAYLGPRDRFTQEVRLHLSGKDFPPHVVESVVRFLKERKLLDDEKTTTSLIERQSGKRSVGIDKLRAELERLGAPEELIEAKLGTMSDSERALGALRAKYKVGAGRAKAGRFLYGRGFAEDAIEAALDQFCASTPE